MGSLVVFGGRGAGAMPGLPRVTVDGVTVPCAVVPTSPPDFASGADVNAHAVLLRVRAVSCNYRDRSFVQGMGAVSARRYSAIGSEFVGEVLEVGREVTGLARGDRVMPNHHYTGTRVGGAAGPGAAPAQGVVTNRASREFHVVGAHRLVRVPDSMPDVVAAAFSLGAQTAHSIVRRVAPDPGETVLLTAGGSNTSLFALGELRGAGARIFATTTSPTTAERLCAAGAERAIVVPRDRDAAAGHPSLSAAAAEVGGFDAVIDPFFDLHLEAVIDLLAPFGRYITCGLAGQTDYGVGAAGGDRPIDGRRLLLAAIVKNLSIIGNCLGGTADLERALRGYAASAGRVVIDSVYSGRDAAAFLDRSFNARDRFGKVVFRLSS